IPPARGWPCGSRIPTPRTCSRNRQVLKGIHRDGSKACPPRGTRSTSSPAKSRGATDAQGEVRYQDAIGGRRGASMAGIGRHGLVVIRSSHEDNTDTTTDVLMHTAEPVTY